MSLFNPLDLQAFMNRRGIQGEIIHLAEPTPTVESAARAVGAQTDHIVKSILFTVDEQPVLAVTCGDRFVYAGGGAENALVRLDPGEILRASGARVINLHTGAEDV
jgi:prolyl-tRNA editing enzyme YbaK/EbsC (Cys-tRNA(Pro) deacylase)